jgi:hypothetical protein
MGLQEGVSVNLVVNQLSAADGRPCASSSTAGKAAASGPRACSSSGGRIAAPESSGAAVSRLASLPRTIIVFKGARARFGATAPFRSCVLARHDIMWSAAVWRRVDETEPTHCAIATAHCLLSPTMEHVRRWSPGEHALGHTLCGKTACNLR